MSTERVAVLLAAGAATWEVEALQALDGRDPRVVLLKRCVDLPDLLATATTGQARAAVVSDELDGLDTEAAAVLARSGVAVVVVRRPGTAPGDDRVGRLGLRHRLAAPEIGMLPDALVAAVATAEEPPQRPSQPGGGAPVAAPVADPVATPRLRGAPSGASPDGEQPGSGRSRTVAVWGPGGAPGRTTVAVGVAAELAHRGSESLLVDADCHGGTVAQHLGLLDEGSGLLAAVRQANAGHLDRPRLAGLAREVAPRLRVLTGLPRPDRWSEVREAAYAGVLDAAVGLGDVVVLDLGFDLDPGSGLVAGPVRSMMARASLARADDVVVVGAADPVGLTRLARGLVDLLSVVPEHGSPVRLHVLVNRTRPTLGWSERDVRRMVEGFVRPTGMFFVPDDRATADRALMQGRSLVELGDSPLRRALERVAAALADAPAAPPRGRTLRRRRAGTGR